MSTAKAPSIDHLQELALAEPPFSYFPQTWGWLALLLVLLLVAAIWGVLRWRRWHRDRYRREALARLELLGRALDDREQRLPALRELPELLKRVALSMPDAPPVASLGGKPWQDFLAQRCATPLPEDFTTRLATLAYAPDSQLAGMPDAEVRSVFVSCRQWIEAHHVAV